jgi:hypothetical protein
MKVWITKYALSRGLFQVDAEMVHSGGVVYAHNGTLFTREWVKTEQEAREVWERARQRKIAALKKQIKKLEAMSCKIERGDS